MYLLLLLFFNFVYFLIDKIQIYPKTICQIIAKKKKKKTTSESFQISFC